MADDAQEKTERATDRKREKSREKGKVNRSKDLVSMAGMGGLIMILYFGGKNVMLSLAEMVGGSLSLSYGRDPAQAISAVVLQAGILLAPFFAMAVAMGIGASVAQGGFVFKPLKFEINKINPINGLKKMFSSQGLTELLKSIAKVGAGCWIVYYVIKKNMEVYPALAAMEISGITKVAGELMMSAILISFLYFSVVAIFSAILEKWQHEKSLRMTKQEIKEEQKETDGDPMIKSRIKSIQREMARKRMMQEVPDATVVITNPQHLAVAIKYEDSNMHAPKIVAKGAGVIAAKIKEIAKEHNVPVVEDKPIARALFKLELNTFIPEELYVAVAKILAYIYKLKGKL
jgi:flagellar biosynthetic protein FlhB